MIPLNQAYDEILLPREFVKNFVDMEHFKEWCRGGLINDCKAMLDIFINYEMYEYCQAIQDVIDEKVDFMLGGLGFC